MARTVAARCYINIVEAQQNFRVGRGSDCPFGKVYCRDGYGCCPSNLNLLCIREFMAKPESTGYYAEPCVYDVKHDDKIHVTIFMAVRGEPVEP